MPPRSAGTGPKRPHGDWEQSVPNVDSHMAAPYAAETRPCVSASPAPGPLLGWGPRNEPRSCAAGRPRSPVLVGYGADPQVPYDVAAFCGRCVGSERAGPARACSYIQNAQNNAQNVERSCAAPPRAIAGRPSFGSKWRKDGSRSGL
jgi:hypothetical protein